MYSIAYPVDLSGAPFLHSPKAILSHIRQPFLISATLHLTSGNIYIIFYFPCEDQLSCSLRFALRESIFPSITSVPALKTNLDSLSGLPLEIPRFCLPSNTYTARISTISRARNIFQVIPFWKHTFVILHCVKTFPPSCSLLQNPPLTSTKYFRTTSFSIYHHLTTCFIFVFD